MDRHELDKIRQFLTMEVGLVDLYAYLQIDTDCEKNEVEDALRKRRSWAQGQQANPKYRSQALWVIKNIQLLRSALIDEKSEYLDDMQASQEAAAFESLTRFILEQGQDYSPTGEESIFSHGAELGLTAPAIRGRIDALQMIQENELLELDAPREAEKPSHYDTLGATIGDSTEAIESAYRAKYRWARNLRDTEQGGRIYAELDEAWRVLKDPQQRADYDDAHGFKVLGDTRTEQETAAEHIGYLPPPSEVGPSLASAEVSPPPVSASSDLAPPLDDLADHEDGDRPFASGEKLEQVLEEPEETATLASAENDDHRLAGAEDQKPSAEALVDDNPIPSRDTGLDIGELMDAAASMDGDEESVVMHIGDIDELTEPTLHLVGSKHHRIRTGKQPFPVHITVQNTGSGQMTGSIVCDLDWVTISPAFLSPNRSEHTIEILFDPDKMPANSATATITVNTDHGESETITVDVQRHLVSPIIMIVAALALLAITGLVGGIYISGLFGTAPAVPVRTILTVHIDPPAGEVFIDDTLVGNQGTLSLVDAFPIDKTFQLRVELDGFEPWTKDVMVPMGQQIRVEADLLLRDPMTFIITPTMRAAEIDAKTILHRLENHKERLANCLTRHLKTDSPYLAAVTARIIVSSRGYVATVEYFGANFDSLPVEHCLSRQLRALKLPIIPADYAVFENTFRARVGPATRAAPKTQATAEK